MSLKEEMQALRAEVDKAPEPARSAMLLLCKAVAELATGRVLRGCYNIRAAAYTTSVSDARAAITLALTALKGEKP